MLQIMSSIKSKKNRSLAYADYQYITISDTSYQLVSCANTGLITLILNLKITNKILRCISNI